MAMNVYQLVTEHNFHIDDALVPLHLKCERCRTVLKDACRLQCGCAFCRRCLEGLMAGGAEFCPGPSGECGTACLSGFCADQRANRSVAELMVSCPKCECAHTCPLIDMEDHFRVCSRNRAKCPFSEFGCGRDSFSTEELSAHLQQETRAHAEIWIEMVGRVNNEIEMLKRDNKSTRDQYKSMQIQIKSIKDENKSIKDENKSIKDENKSIKDENKSIKDQNKSIKDQNKSMQIQIKSIKDENKAIKDENKAIKDENKAIKDENKSIKDQNKSIMSENKSIRDEMKTIQDKIVSMANEIEAAKEQISLVSDEAKPVKCEIAEINKGIKSTTKEIKFVNANIRSIEALAGKVDCSLVWVVHANLLRSIWELADKHSRCFSSAGDPYEYRLFSSNGGFFFLRLQIQLVIQPGEYQSDFDWPSRRRVVVTVSDTGRPDANLRISRLCRIAPAPSRESRVVDLFEFSHSELVDAGVDLSRGVRVTCLVVLDFP